MADSANPQMPTSERRKRLTRLQGFADSGIPFTNQTQILLIIADALEELLDATGLISRQLDEMSSKDTKSE